MSLTASSSISTVSLLTILSESKRIINAHSRHFLLLSVLFILPLAFSITVYPTLQTLFLADPSNTITSQLFLANPNHDFTKPFFLSLLYSIFLLTFSLLTQATITYSVFHAFFGRPVKILHTVQYLARSFLPLLATVLLAQVLLSALCVVFAGLLFVFLFGFRVFGFPVEFDSVWVQTVGLIAGLCLLGLLVWVQVRWVLMGVIVVLESSWGVEPLKRSAWLINGFKKVAFSMILFFGVLSGVLFWGSYAFATQIGVLDSWAFVLQIVVTTAGLTLILLYNSAACTVLYMYCKAVHGELAWEIAQEFSREYVSLPFDDGKVPHVVSIMHH